MDLASSSRRFNPLLRGHVPSFSGGGSALRDAAAQAARRTLSGAASLNTSTASQRRQPFYRSSRALANSSFRRRSRPYYSSARGSRPRSARRELFYSSRRSPASSARESAAPSPRVRRTNGNASQDAQFRNGRYFRADRYPVNSGPVASAPEPVGRDPRILLRDPSFYVQSRAPSYESHRYGAARSGGASSKRQFDEMSLDGPVEFDDYNDGDGSSLLATDPKMFQPSARSERLRPTAAAASRRPSSARPRRPNSSLGLLSSGVSVAPSTAADSPFIVRHRRGSLGGSTELRRPSSASRASSRSRFSVDRVRAEVEEKHRAECTFKPRINKTSRSLRSSLIGASPRKHRRIERLARSRRRDYEQRRLEKRRREEERLNRFTFRPRTNTTRLERKRLNPREAAERLSREARRKTESRERAKRRREMREMRRCEFRPRVNRSRSVDLSNYRPLRQRVGEIRRNKHETIHRMRLRRLRHPDNRFAPRINKVSARLARARFNDSAHADRIARRLAREKDRKERMHEEQERKLSMRCTFQPRISTNTQKIAKRSNLFSSRSLSGGPSGSSSGGGGGGIDNFLQRRGIYDAREKSRRRIEEANKTRHKYRPQISRTSRLLVESKLERAGESERDKLRRLVYKDKQKIEALKETIVEEYYARFSHRPRINNMSRAIAPHVERDDIASLDSKRRAHDNARERAERRFKRRYTFKPHMRANSSFADESRYRLGVSDPTGLVGKFEEMRRDKDRRIARAKKAQRYEELNGCTFRPFLPSKNTVRQSIGKDSRHVVVVRGLETHLNRTEAASRKKDDRQRREAEVFGSKAVMASGNPRGYTITEPFHLSRNNLVAEMKRKEVVDRWRREELKECTHRPRTNIISDSLVSDIIGLY